MGLGPKAVRRVLPDPQREQRRGRAPDDQAWSSGGCLSFLPVHQPVPEVEPEMAQPEVARGSVPGDRCGRAGPARKLSKSGLTGPGLGPAPGSTHRWPPVPTVLQPLASRSRGRGALWRLLPRCAARPGLLLRCPTRSGASCAGSPAEHLTPAQGRLSCLL